MRKTINLLSLMLCLALTIGVITGCGSGSDGGSEQPGGGDNPGQTVTVYEDIKPGNAAGFRLSHTNGLTDQDDQYSYNSDLFYRNEAHVDGADPGAIYVSVEDARDSYNKRMQSYKYDTGNGVYDWIDGGEQAFLAEYGTESEYVEAYGDRYYLCVTGHTGSITNDMKESYGDDIIHAAFPMYSCEDFTNWEACGPLGSYAIAVREGSWSATSYWAPEMLRDQNTGLYYIYFSAQSKPGNSATTYGALTTAGATFHYAHVAVSTTPLGPYEYLTTESYIQLHAAKNKDGSVKFDEEWLTDERTSHRYHAVHSQEGEHIGYYNNNTGIYYNLNGYEITIDTPIMNLGYYYPRYGNITENVRKEMDEYLTKKKCVDGEYAYGFGGIDIYPAVDNTTGDIYCFISTLGTTTANAFGLWAWGMRDHVTPDWPSLTMVARPNTSTIIPDGSFLGDWQGDMAFSGGDEAPEILQHDGKWYLTYSYNAYMYPNYSVGIAIADNPLGPYDKLGGLYSPVIGIGTEYNNYKTGTGHHCFIKAGDELFFIYHALQNPENNYDNKGNYLSRHLCIDRAAWKYEPELGYDMLYCNGATVGLQPKPETYTGYTNVAKKATVTGNGDVGTADMLNDGLVTAQPFSRKFEYGKSDGGLYVTLTWDSPVTVRSVMIYNSASYYTAFNKANVINFKLAEKPVWYAHSEYNGYCNIKNLTVDPREAVHNYQIVRHGSAAIAEFEEIKITEMTVYISGEKDDKFTDMDEYGDYADGYKQVNICEIYVFGKEN